MTTEMKLILAGLIIAGYVVMFGVLNIEHSKLLAVTAELQAAQADNKQDQDVITNAQSELKVWQARAAANLKAEQDAVADSQKQLEAIQQREAQLTKMEQSDHAKPGCESLLGADLAAVCPGYAAAVRLRNAASGVSGPPGADSRPSPH